MATKSRKLGPAGQVYDNERVAVLQRLEAKEQGRALGVAPVRSSP